MLIISMEDRYNVKKIYWIFGACLIIFVIFIIFYTTGFLKNINKDTISSVISYIEENAHTGLDKSPGVQMAFEEKAKPAKTYVIEVPKKTEQPSGLVIGERQTQLFDIKLELDSVFVSKADDLGLRVNFTNFGNTPTPVTMTFNILDSSNQVIYSKTESIIVETEVVYNKNFAGLVLSPGDYIIKLKTLYGVDVKDEFQQSFGIKSPFNWASLRFYVAGLLAVVIVIALVLPKRFYSKSPY